MAPLDDGGGWHLDRKVPIAMILAFVAQSIALIVAGTIFITITNARLDNLELFAEDRAEVIVRLSVLDAHIIELRRSIERIRDYIQERDAGR